MWPYGELNPFIYGTVATILHQHIARAECLSIFELEDISVLTTTGRVYPEL